MAADVQDRNEATADKRIVPQSVYLTEPLAEALTRRAQELGTSRSSAAHRILAEALGVDDDDAREYRTTTREATAQRRI